MTKREDTIEAMARELYVAAGGSIDQFRRDCSKPDNIPIPPWVSDWCDRAPWIALATAALDAALRVLGEPDEGMCKAFTDRALRSDIASEGGWHGYARNQLRAMLATVGEK